MRGSCDCAQDDTWLAQGDDMVVVRTGWHPVGAARWSEGAARAVFPGSGARRNVSLLDGNTARL